MNIMNGNIPFYYGAGGIDLAALEAEIAGKQAIAEKDQPNGYPGLDAEGNIVGRMILADATGVSLQPGELGLNAAVELIIGTAAGRRLVFDKTKAMIDAYGTLNAAAAAIPAGAAKMLTVRETTVADIRVKTTTGYARGMNWDGTLTDNAGSGTPSSNIEPTWLTAAAPYTARIPKLIAVWSTDSGGNPSGEITYIICNNQHLTALDVSSVFALTHIYCLDNQLSSLDVSSNTDLFHLDCAGNQLASIDVSANTNLNALLCSRNQLTALNVSANTDLISLGCSNNQLTALDVSTNVSLLALECLNNQLSVLSLPVVEQPAEFIISDDTVTPITSSKSAIEAWFTSLPEIEFSVDLYVGAAVLALDPAPDTTIATAKGWVVVGDYE